MSLPGIHAVPVCLLFTLPPHSSLLPCSHARVRPALCERALLLPCRPPNAHHLTGLSPREAEQDLVPTLDRWRGELPSSGMASPGSLGCQGTEPRPNAGPGCQFCPPTLGSSWLVFLLITLCQNILRPSRLLLSTRLLVKC